MQHRIIILGTIAAVSLGRAPASSTKACWASGGMKVYTSPARTQTTVTPNVVQGGAGRDRDEHEQCRLHQDAHGQILAPRRSSVR